MKPVDEHDVFERGDLGSIDAYLTWAPTALLEGDVVLRMFDERNTLVGQTRPLPTKLKKGASVFTAWNVPLPDRAGDYRFDVLIGPTVYWRSYATVTDPEPSLDPGGGKDTPPPPGESSAPRRIDGVIPPQKVIDVRPIYPVSAQDAKVQGAVVITATIDPTGEVTNARVLRSIPALDHAALEAVRRWRFTATLLDGMPVLVIMTMTVNFSLR